MTNMGSKGTNAGLGWTCPHITNMRPKGSNIGPVGTNMVHIGTNMGLVNDRYVAL